MVARTTKKKTSRSKAVAAKPATEVAPDYINTESNRGSEGVGVEDLIIPRLNLAQDLSPEVKKSKDEYIDGLEPGQFFNSVTREIYGSEVRLVPAMYRKEFLLFIPRNSGGGFRGSFPTHDAAVAEMNRLEDEAGEHPELIDAGVHYCLIGPANGEAMTEIAVSMTKSKQKVSRNWNTQIKMLGGDRFARGYVARAVEDESVKGEYWNLMVTTAGWASKMEYSKGEKLYNDIKKGLVTVAHDDGTEEESEEF